MATSVKSARAGRGCWVFSSSRAASGPAARWRQGQAASRAIVVGPPGSSARPPAGAPTRVYPSLSLTRDSESGILAGGSDDLRLPAAPGPGPAGGPPPGGEALAVAASRADSESLSSQALPAPSAAEAARA
jgi:hypothetical protein